MPGLTPYLLPVGDGAPPVDRGGAGEVDVVEGHVGHDPRAPLERGDVVDPGAGKQVSRKVKLKAAK